MKSATERDLSHVRADLSRVHRSMHSACLNLNANQRSAETKSSVSQDKDKDSRFGLESIVREKTRENIELQTKVESQSSEFSAR